MVDDLQGEREGGWVEGMYVLEWSPEGSRRPPKC